jgi:hypothetical protein
VVRAICEAFADNISGSLPLVEPLLNEVPCGDIWVDGLVCNILSYCHLALAHPQRALDVQQHVSGNQATNRNLFVEVYRVFVLALGQLRQGDLQKPNARPSRRCTMRSTIPDKIPVVAPRWPRCWPKSPGSAATANGSTVC